MGDIFDDHMGDVLRGGVQFPFSLIISFSLVEVEGKLNVHAFLLFFFIAISKGCIAAAYQFKEHL